MIQIFNKRFYNGDGYYCGRPSLLGNPFTHLKNKGLAEFVVSNRDEAVEKFADWFPKQIKTNHLIRKEFKKLVDQYLIDGELKLICWCAPSNCHLYIIADLIEAEISK